MSRYLEIRQWIRTNESAYAAALLAGGQYVAVGTERGVEVFDVTGRRHLDYPPGKDPLPVQQLAVDDGRNRGSSLFLGPLYIATRHKGLVQLDLERERPDEQFGFQVQTLYEEASDLQALHESPSDLYARRDLPDTLHSLSFSAGGKLLAVGHLGPALALLNDKGNLLWRRHPDDGRATQGQVWSVALDAEGKILYVGSAGKGTNGLASLQAGSNSYLGRRRLKDGERATAVACLPNGQGMAVALSENMLIGHVAAYSPDLNELLWEHSFDEQVTALAVDPQQPILAIGVGYAGEIIVIDTQNGHVLTSGLYLKTVINGLDIDEGRILAAATQDGQLALIHYQSEEFHL